MPDRRQNNDHDVLIEVRTKVDVLTRKVDDLTNNIVVRVDKLEDQATAAKSIADQLVEKDRDKETRIRFIERYVWGAIAIIGLVNLIGFAYLIDKLRH